MVPRLVLIVMSRVPERGSPPAGGVPTSLRFLFGAWDGEALGFGLGFHRQLAGAAAAAARSDISRSRRARAAARWRSLVGLTVLYLPRSWCAENGQDFADGEPDGAGVADGDAADPVGDGWLPMASAWMVISFFGCPPPP